MIKKLFYRLGFDLRRLTIDHNLQLQLLKGLKHFDVDLVFDIGANIGQFASELLTIGYNRQIVSLLF